MSIESPDVVLQRRDDGVLVFDLLCGRIGQIGQHVQLSKSRVIEWRTDLQSGCSLGSDASLVERKRRVLFFGLGRFGRSGLLGCDRRAGHDDARDFLKQMFAQVVADIQRAASECQTGKDPASAAGLFFLEPVDRSGLFLQEPCFQTVGQCSQTVRCGHHVQFDVGVLKVLSIAFQFGR